MAACDVRVAVWADRIPPHLAAALKEVGYEIVCHLQGRSETIPSYPLPALFGLDRRCDALLEGIDVRPWTEPIPDDVLLEYYEGVLRISPVAGAGEIETLRISPLLFDAARDRAYRHAAVLAAILRRHAPELMLFHVLPHLGLDTLTDHVARTLGIPSLGLRQVRVPGRFIAYDLNRPGRPRVAPEPVVAHAGGAVDPAVAAVARGDKPMRDRLTALGFYLGGWLRHGRAALFDRAHEAVKARQWVPAFRVLDSLDRRTRPVATLRYRRARRYAREWRRLPRADERTLAGDFVFFPLHLEPEANISAYGGRYKNQMLTLECLHAVLPPGWRIVVKENPKQGEAWRSGDFFARLRRLDRIVVSERPSRQLIADCRLVASICGSAGYEALLAGRPSIHFGDAWYAGLAGTYSFEPGLDLRAIAEAPVERAALDQSADTLFSSFHRGVVFSRDLSLRPRFDPVEIAGETARSLAALFERVLKPGPSPERPKAEGN